MKQQDRNETNHGTAGEAVADASPKGGDAVMEGENGTWHADCFEGAAQEGSDMEHDTNDTDKEKKEVYELLMDIDPTRQQTYERINQ